MKHLPESDNLTSDLSDQPRSKMLAASGWLWSAGAVALGTACLWIFQSAIDKGQASLLYLPIVLFCAIRFGYGQAIGAAVLSFFCWDFFFLPPRFTLTVVNPRDTLSLFVFLIAAVVTARLSSRIRQQAAEAQVREHEISTLFNASEAISAEIDADSILPALASQIVSTCRASRCIVLRQGIADAMEPVASVWSDKSDHAVLQSVVQVLAEAVFSDDQEIGFGQSPRLLRRAMETMELPAEYDRTEDPGIYVPLHAQSKLVGVLHVGPRIMSGASGKETTRFSDTERRLILTLSNHAAVVLARQTLSDQAAEADALRRADTLKDALLSMVSHELRSPLAAIKVAASGLRQSDAVWDSADRDAAIRGIDVEADRLIGVVNNLLDLSRLEGGAWAPNRDWCDMAEIVGTVIGQLTAEADRIITDVPDDLPLIKVDYVQIMLVLTNLLQNALKYSNEDSNVELSAQTDTCDVEGVVVSGVKVSVRDHGPGITPGEETKIFERFFRGDRHRNSTIHGTGVGLTLCRAVVLAHKGQIWAENYEDDPQSRGSVFQFFLPIG